MKLKLFILSAAVSFIVVLVGLCFIVGTHSKNEMLSEQLNSCNAERKEQISNNSINDCYDREWQKYATDWDVECKSIGLDVNCDLPANLADKLDSEVQQSYDRCVEVYK